MLNALAQVLRACTVLALVVTAGQASAQKTAAEMPKLLQGAQSHATIEGGARTGRGVLREGAAALMAEAMAVSQALEGETAALGEQVKLEIFTSAGSAECRKVFHSVIARVLQKEGMLDVVDLRMVFWGDGDVVDKDDAQLDAAGIAAVEDASAVQFSCSLHGDPSCAGNAWLACLASRFPDANDYFPVLNCIEGRACADDEQAPDQCYGSVPEVAPVCAQEFGEGLVDPDALAECAGSDEGRGLLLANAQMTAALDPPVKFLPWIVVDGKPLGAENKDGQLLLGKAICDAYVIKGGEEPYSCALFPQSLDDLDDPWGLGEPNNLPPSCNPAVELLRGLACGSS